MHIGVACGKEQPLDRMLAVVERVLAHSEPPAVATLAPEFDLPLPSIARLVARLGARGWIRRAPSGRLLLPGARLIRQTAKAIGAAVAIGRSAR